MEISRLQQIADQAGMSLREASRTQLDDEGYDGKLITKDREMRRKIHKFFSLAAFFGAAYMGVSLFSGKVKPFAFYDIDGDGKKDAVVAYPVDHTDKAILGYINARDLPEGYRKDIDSMIESGTGPVMFRTTLISFRPFKSLESVSTTKYNCPNNRLFYQLGTLVDVDGNGMADLELITAFPERCGREVVYDIFGKREID